MLPHKSPLLPVRAFGETENVVGIEELTLAGVDDRGDALEVEEISASLPSTHERQVRY